MPFGKGKGRRKPPPFYSLNADLPMLLALVCGEYVWPRLILGLTIRLSALFGHDRRCYHGMSVQRHDYRTHFLASHHNGKPARITTRHSSLYDLRLSDRVRHPLNGPNRPVQDPKDQLLHRNRFDYRRRNFLCQSLYRISSVQRIIRRWDMSLDPERGWYYHSTSLSRVSR